MAANTVDDMAESSTASQGIDVTSIRKAFVDFRATAKKRLGTREYLRELPIVEAKYWACYLLVMIARLTESCPSVSATPDGGRYIVVSRAIGMLEEGDFGEDDVDYWEPFFQASLGRCTLPEFLTRMSLELFMADLTREESYGVVTRHSLAGGMTGPWHGPRESIDVEAFHQNFLAPVRNIDAITLDVFIAQAIFETGFFRSAWGWVDQWARAQKPKDWFVCRMDWLSTVLFTEAEPRQWSAVALQSKLPENDGVAFVSARDRAPGHVCHPDFLCDVAHEQDAASGDKARGARSFDLAIALHGSSARLWNLSRPDTPGTKPFNIDSDYGGYLLTKTMLGFLIMGNSTHEVKRKYVF